MVVLVIVMVMVIPGHELGSAQPLRRHGNGSPGTGRSTNMHLAQNHGSGNNGIKPWQHLAPTTQPDPYHAWCPGKMFVFMPLTNLGVRRGHQLPTRCPGLPCPQRRQRQPGHPGPARGHAMGHCQHSQLRRQPLSADGVGGERGRHVRGCAPGVAGLTRSVPTRYSWE